MEERGKNSKESTAGTHRTQRDGGVGGGAYNSGLFFLLSSLFCLVSYLFRLLSRLLCLLPVQPVYSPNLPFSHPKRALAQWVVHLAAGGGHAAEHGVMLACTSRVGFVGTTKTCRNRSSRGEA